MFPFDDVIMRPNTKSMSFKLDETAVILAMAGFNLASILPGHF